jgi:hypothetical protein
MSSRVTSFAGRYREISAKPVSPCLTLNSDVSDRRATGGGSCPSSRAARAAGARAIRSVVAGVR